jgi:hypothetical protein
MVRRVLSGLMIVAGVAAIAGPAAAGDYRAYKLREYVRDTPVKDCTRINGRSGYYGNPWCTPAEQERWDRWEAGHRWTH